MPWRYVMLEYKKEIANRVILYENKGFEGRFNSCYTWFYFLIDIQWHQYYNLFKDHILLMQNGHFFLNFSFDSSSWLWIIANVSTESSKHPVFESWPEECIRRVYHRYFVDVLILVLLFHHRCIMILRHLCKLKPVRATTKGYFYAPIILRGLLIIYAMIMVSHSREFYNACRIKCHVSR